MCFSHATALTLFGAPVPWSVQSDERIHVTVTAPARAPQIGGVAGHVASAPAVVQHDGLPLTSPEQTWLDSAATARREELVSIGDFFLAHGLATLDSLTGALLSAPRRRGLAIARQAIPLLRLGSESPAESLLRVVLHDAGLLPPFLNYRIHGRDGGFLARVDMAYPEQRVALEYEGDHHRVEREQWHKDIHRQGSIEDLGWRVIRATAADLREPSEFVTRVRRALTGEW